MLAVVAVIALALFVGIRVALRLIRRLHDPALTRGHDAG